MQNENEKEIWVSVPFDFNYEVSSLGRIKSYKRGKEKILSPYKSKKGYIYINLCVNKKRLVMTVHRIMAMAFFDVTTDRMTVVDHIDMDKANNRLENLRIISQRENTSFDRPHRDLPMGVYRTKSPGIYRVLRNVGEVHCYYRGYGLAAKTKSLYDFATPEEVLEWALSQRNTMELVQHEELSPIDKIFLGLDEEDED